VAYPNGTIDTPLSSGDIAERLAAKVHAGVFYPGYRGIGLRRGWLYEGKVTEEGFSIRRITSYKALYPMLIGTFTSTDQHTIIHLRIDRNHFKQMYWIVYGATGAISLAVASILLLGRSGGVFLPSSYVAPISIVAGAMLFIAIIRGITIFRYKRDCAFLQKTLASDA